MEWYLHRLHFPNGECDGDDAQCFDYWCQSLSPFEGLGSIPDRLNRCLTRGLYYELGQNVVVQLAVIFDDDVSQQGPFQRTCWRIPKRLEYCCCCCSIGQDLGPK